MTITKNTLPPSAYKKDDNYNLLLVISNDDYKESILGDPKAEPLWQKVINNATAEIMWRYTEGKALLTEDGDRLSEDDYAELYGLDLESVTLVECCYSANYSETFDYYELWELVMSESVVIDFEEGGSELLDSLLKEQKYYCGHNGGYIAHSIIEQHPEILKEATPSPHLQDLETVFNNPAYRVPGEEFQQALDESYFDGVLSEPELFRPWILANLEEIASNFNEENAYCSTGAEPKWLLDALLDAGVEFG